MSRFCVPFHAGEKDIWIDGAEAHHMLRVKRYRIGDSVVLFNGVGDECIAEIIEVKESKVRAKIGQIKAVSKERKVEIDLAFAIPKGKRSHFLVQKCAELGVQKLFPLHYERSIVRIKNGSSEKVEKWRKIAIEASKQCGRNTIIDVNDVMDYGNFLKRVESYDISLFACNQSDSNNLKNILKEYQRVNSIISFIGPEGGFTLKEMEMARRAGCKFVSLGQHTLRVETSAIAISAILSYHFFD